jgi:DNA-directed RNA polymerase specialized sigma24 family protein
MPEASTPPPQSNNRWLLNKETFGLLLKWLDCGKDSHGKEYLEMRRRLVSYFDRKNCKTPDDLADETLNRVARRLQEEGNITSETPARYCYIVARFVFLEYNRQSVREPLSLEDFSKRGYDPSVSVTSRAKDEDEGATHEQRLACLERCLKDFESRDRELIIHYYEGEQRTKIQNRRSLAARFALTGNALSIRACRLRSKLENCVGECMAK